MSRYAISACGACGERVPVGFRLCKVCDGLNFNLNKAKGRRIIVESVKMSRRDRYDLLNPSPGRVEPVMKDAFSWVKRDYPFVSKLGRYKTFSAMCSAGAKHGNKLQKERGCYPNGKPTKETLMFRAGQKKVTDYFSSKNKK